ncbi:hypothetical protein [Massilia timonae]|uniref:hypothetical protein n=1 Tax=Massilia timonae TaxID=47229 RepID=UPI0028976B5A|nr:hypothetical protein [Massilia timonae]
MNKDDIEESLAKSANDSSCMGVAPASPYFYGGARANIADVPASTGADNEISDRGDTQ